MLAPLTPNEASKYREAVVLHPFTDQKTDYKAGSILQVTGKGIVIAVGTSRTFYPWNRVTQFTYHHDDVEARRVIQGY